MENIEALQALERGEKLDQETLLRLHNEHLIDITEATNMQSTGPEFIFVGFTPQGFGLLEKAKAPLVSDLERQILHAVVRGFLDRHEATATKALLKRFKSALSTALQRLSHRGVLNVANNTYLSETYLPTTLAFHHCGDSAALAFARRSTETVLRVLPSLFDRQLDAEGEQRQYTAEDVLDEAKGFDSSIDSDAIFAGLYLAQEFSVFTGYRKDDRQVGIVSFSLGERVYEKQYLDWNQRIQQGNVALIYDQQSQPKKDAVPVSVPSNLELIAAEGLEPYSFQRDNSIPIREQRMNSLSVLISHSSKDHQLASALIDFLRSGLGLLPRQIRCSSVDGYRLPAGVQTDRQLRDEVTASKVLIGLITPNSLASPYVLFELGARWGAGERMIPLLAGVTADQLRGPLSGINALSCSSEEQLHQTLQEIGSHLGMEVQSPAAYLKQLRAVVESVDNVVAPSPSSAGAGLQNTRPEETGQPLVIPLRYGAAPTSAGKRMMRYHGLVVANHGEPAYDVSVLTSEIQIGTSKLQLVGNRPTLTKADGDAFFAAAIERSPGSHLLGNGLFNEMIKQQVAELTVELIYKDAENRWYKTVGKIERNVSEPGGLSVGYIRREPTKQPKQE